MAKSRKLTPAIQEAIVTVLCYDDSNRTAQTLLGVINPREFDPYFREVAQEAVEYIERYGHTAGDHTLDLIDSIAARHPDKEEFYHRIFESMQATRKTVDREFVLDQASKFAERQRLKRALSEAVDALDRDDENTVSDIRNSLTSGLNFSVQSFSPGVRFGDASNVDIILSDEEDALPTGIPALDSKGLGPAPGQLHMLAAGAKKGKSWWGLNLCKQAMMHGHHAVYISLENSERVTLRRSVQTWFSVTKRRAKQELWRMEFEHDERGIFTSMAEVDIPKRPSLDDRDIGAKIGKLFGRLRNRPHFYIKCFPSGSLTISQLKAYLDGLEVNPGIRPGFVFLDYLDLMDVKVDNMRQSLNRLGVELRGIAGDRKIRLATVSQLNRKGIDSPDPKGTDLSEDIGKLQTADTMLIYAQTAAEKELGLGRIKVEASREEEDGFQVLLAQNYAVGQFAMDSVRMSNTYWDQLHSTHEADEDMPEDDDDV